MTTASQSIELTSFPETAAPARQAEAIFLPIEDDSNQSLRLASIGTLVLWSGCLAIGVLGFRLGYQRPVAPAPAHEPLVVEKLDVTLTNEPLPETNLQPVDSLSAPPPPSAIAQPAVSPTIAVADPSAVAFALPVEGPAVVVSANQAAHGASAVVAEATTAASGLPAPETLVFGQGEGRQPAPEYPSRAMKLGQEGVVGVRLTVSSEGRVITTSVANSSTHPMLDDAAERCVKYRWRFSRGQTRVYDVSIRFALAK